MLRERSKRATHAEDRMRAASAGPVQVSRDLGQSESMVGRKRNHESTLIQSRLRSLRLAVMAIVPTNDSHGGSAGRIGCHHRDMDSKCLAANLSMKPGRSSNPKANEALRGSQPAKRKICTVRRDQYCNYETLLSF